MDQRLQELRHWLEYDLGMSGCEPRPASSDASFRRYFRIESGGRSYIVMDAPPEREDCGPFVEVARSFLDIGLNVPEIIRADPARGFLLLSDLGDRLYLQALDEASVDRLYADALAALVVIQGCGPRNDTLPPYDRNLLMTEMALFRDWLLGRHLGMELKEEQQRALEDTFKLLADNALEQPQVCVHRDYHSRNLMVTGRNNPGILDFQDAVVGPVTYDLVSLLRDCYIAWPRERVEDWALGYQELAMQSGILRPEHKDGEQFLRWFDLMGVQRHLKASGIFARLMHRDGKAGYLKDIPRTLGYVKDVCGRYPELEPLDRIVRTVLEEVSASCRALAALR